MKRRFLVQTLTASAFIVGIAVQASAGAPTGRYAISDDTVTDTMTGLLWQRRLEPKTFTFAEANAYCASLALAGGGFRLPSMKEMATIVDDTAIAPAIDSGAFPGVPYSSWDWTWTSTPVAGLAGEAWILDSAGGGIVAYDWTAKFLARCVR